MNFLIDNMLSVELAQTLIVHGHRAVHVRDLGLAAALDVELLEIAKIQRRVIISADRDFGTLLAELKADQPSVIYLRGGVERDPVLLADRIASNLPRIATALAAGAIVVIEPGRIRIRKLPIEK